MGEQSAKSQKIDGRRNNGGHSTAGHAGRKPVANPKISKTVSLTASDWAYLDDPENGKSRGEIVSRLIDSAQSKSS